MRDLLVSQLELLCQYYRIKAFKDFDRISIQSGALKIKGVQETLKKTGLFESVEVRHWPSAAAVCLHLWPCGKEDVGIEIVVSRIAPFFYCDWLRKEGWDSAIDFSLPTAREILRSETYKRYLKALNEPIPRNVMQLRKRVLPIVAAKGFILIAQSQLKRRPCVDSVPRFIRNRQLGFFYFHSIPLVAADN